MWFIFKERLKNILIHSKCVQRGNGRDGSFCEDHSYVVLLTLAVTYCSFTFKSSRCLKVKNSNKGLS